MATIRKRWTGRESRALREAMRLSQRDFANGLGISAKSIPNWESGGVDFVPRPESQAILDTKLRLVSDEVRARFELIIGTMSPDDHVESKVHEQIVDSEDSGDSSSRPDSSNVSASALVESSTADAAEIIMSAGQELINPLMMEQFYEEIAHLSVAYLGSTTEANRQILQKATAMRSALKGLVTAYRAPSQASDLYLMIGLLSGICSYACIDLDRPDEAMTQARASFMMGELAGHDGLRAWALGTRSLIARFQNRYVEALGYAREGLQYATTGTALVRLRCGVGQTLAHMGDAANAIDALNLAKDAREHVNSADVVNGLFTFSEAKQTYYSGSSFQWLSGSKNATAAEAESMRAIQMFQSANPENRSPGDVLLAHIYLANSRLTLGEIDGSLEALRPVLDLPPSSRSSWQRKRMRQIVSRLEKANFSDSRLAISARDEISSFVDIP